MHIPSHSITYGHIASVSCARPAKPTWHPSCILQASCQPPKQSTPPAPTSAHHGAPISWVRSNAINFWRPGQASKPAPDPKECYRLTQAPLDGLLFVSSVPNAIRVCHDDRDIATLEIVVACIQLDQKVLRQVVRLQMGIGTLIHAPAYHLAKMFIIHHDNLIDAIVIHIFHPLPVIRWECLKLEATHMRLNSAPMVKRDATTITSMVMTSTYSSE
jgi:hypothetical protein